LRLSSGTINKLTNELKITCNENEELKKRLQDSSLTNKKLNEYESKVALLSQEIERLNGVIDKKNSEIKGLREGEIEAEGMARQVKQLSDQLKRISGENESLYGEVRTGQEQVRLSNSQVTKFKMEIDEYRNIVEELKKKSEQTNTSKITEYENKIAMFSQ
jgi:chromosome segregation ATPase